MQWETAIIMLPRGNQTWLENSPFSSMIFDSRRVLQGRQGLQIQASRGPHDSYPSENTRLVSRESRCHMTPVSQSWMGFEKHHPNHLIVRYGSKSSTQEIAGGDSLSRKHGHGHFMSFFDILHSF